MNTNRHKKGKAADALTARQGRAVLALINTPTVEDAAKRAGVSRGIIYVWLKDETFKVKASRRPSFFTWDV